MEKKRSARDIEKNEMYRLLVEEVKDYAIFMLDRDGNILTWNKGAQRISGYQSEDIIGQNISIFYTEEKIKQGFPEKELRESAANGRFEDEGWRVRKDGTKFWANILVTPLLNENKELIGFSKVTRDLTERKEAEDSLLAAYRELKTFTYVASHDLKTPVRGISTISAILYEDFAGNFDEKGKQLLQLLINRSKRIYNLLDGMMEYAMIGKKSDIPESFNAEEVIQNAIELINPPESTKIIIEQPMPRVNFAKISLVQVFYNLISNAIKYNDKPVPEIRIGFSEEADQLIFYVKDNGIGIKKQHQRKLFQLFQTLERKDKLDALGVGLATVKKIIEGKKGRVWVDSELGEGSTFYFSLPKSAISEV